MNFDNTKELFLNGREVLNLSINGKAAWQKPVSGATLIVRSDYNSNSPSGYVWFLENGISKSVTCMYSKGLTIGTGNIQIYSCRGSGVGNEADFIVLSKDGGSAELIYGSRFPYQLEDGHTYEIVFTFDNDI